MIDKKWYASKTIWMNFVMAIFAVMYMVLPQSKEYLTEANALLAFSFLGTLLRIVTKGKLELW